MGLDDLEAIQGDIQKQVARVRKSVHLNIKDELRDNVYPTIAELTEAVIELRDAVFEEEGVDVEMISKIAGVMTLGLQTVAIVENELGENASDVLKQHIATFKAAATESMQELQQMIEDEEEDEDEKEEGGGNGEGGEDDEEEEDGDEDEDENDDDEGETVVAEDVK